MTGESAVESVAVEAFGATVAVFPPPRARPARHPPERGRLALVKDADDALLNVVCDQKPVAGPVDPRLALGILDAKLRMHIALHAPDHVFVHAGVVGVGERAIVLSSSELARLGIGFHRQPDKNKCR